MKKSKHVLLVEDDNDDQDFFLEALSEISNAALFDIAQDGQEALDLLKNASVLPDIIFMDINMPRMNGIECLSEIIKNPSLRHIPVVILSTSMAQSGAALLPGAKGFIKKGCDGKTLRKQIEQMINFDFPIDINTINRTFATAFILKLNASA